MYGCPSVISLEEMLKLPLVLHNFMVLFQLQLGFVIHVTMQNGTSIKHFLNMVYYTSLFTTKLIIWMQHSRWTMKIGMNISCNNMNSQSFFFTICGIVVWNQQFGWSVVPSVASVYVTDALL